MTAAQDELAQGEIHDSRGLIVSVYGGIDCVEKGLWTFDEFKTWARKIRADHDDKLLRRFERVMAKGRPHG